MTFDASQVSTFPLVLLCLGTDLVYVPRLEKSLTRFGQAFFARLLTPAELAYCFGEAETVAQIHSGNEDPLALYATSSRHTQALTRRNLQRVAARIAVKEAVAKALGTGLNGLGWGQGVSWQEIETLSQPQQAPQLQLYGRAKARADAAGIHRWLLSFSHDGDYATATVIGYP